MRAGSCRLRRISRWRRRSPGGDPGPGVAAVAFGPGAARGDRPGPLGDLLQRLVSAHLRAGGQGHAEGAGHPEHVADAAFLAHLPQPGVLAVDLIGGRPGHLDPGVQRLCQHLRAELRLGRGLQVIGDAHHVAGRRVGQVLFGYPQPGAGQGVPARGGVGGVHEVDRVGDPAGAADVLRLDPGGSFALLDLPALIEDQHR